MILKQFGNGHEGSSTTPRSRCIGHKVDFTFDVIVCELATTMATPRVENEALIKKVCRYFERDIPSIPQRGASADPSSRQRLEKRPCHWEGDIRKISPVVHTSIDLLVSRAGTIRFHLGVNRALLHHHRHPKVVHQKFDRGTCT